jgi:phosphoglycolate phosphatase
MANIRCGDQVFSHIQAIIFDKDGTLSNSQNYLRLIALKRWAMLELRVANRAPISFGNMLLQSWGLRGDRVDPKSMLAVASRRENEIVTAGYVAALGFSWIEAMTIVEECFMAASGSFKNKQELTLVFSEVLPMLQMLRSHKLKLGILSADILPNIQNFVELHGLTSYIDFCQGAQDGLHKPNPKLLELTCAGLGVAASQVLVIGDSSADIELAKQGGAAGAIGVSWGWGEHFDIPNADVMLRSFDQIQVV